MVGAPKRAASIVTSVSSGEVSIAPTAKRHAPLVAPLTQASENLTKRNREPAVGAMSAQPAQERGRAGPGRTMTRRKTGMSMKQNWTPIGLAACAVIGLLVGHSLGSNGEANANIQKRLDRIERDLAALDRLETIESALRTAATERSDQREQAQTAERRVDALATSITALGDRIDGLGERTAALGAALIGVSSVSAGVAEAVSSEIDDAVDALDRSLSTEFMRLGAAVDALAARLERYEAAEIDRPSPQKRLEETVDEPLFAPKRGDPEQLRVEAGAVAAAFAIEAPR